ncbi:hypothetical protein HDE_06850 [Halotydeus destructor]|nr:hypothetical protein HDE_06850 [Halotydeus destructor]
MPYVPLAESLRYLFTPLYATISLHCILWKRKSMVHFVNSVTRGSEQVAEAGNGFLVVYLVSGMLITIQSSLHLYFYSIGNLIRSVLPFVKETDCLTYQVFTYIRFLLYVPWQRNQWILLTVALYCKTYDLIVHLREALLDNVRNTLVTDEPYLKAAIVSKRKLDVYMKRFEKIYNVFPFMWFSYLFVRSSGFILYLMKANTTLKLIGPVLNYASDLLIIFAMLLHLDRTEGRLAEKVDECDNWLFEVCPKFSDLSSKLRSELRKKVKCTAMSYFELNRTLVLSFSGSLITFTVLFVQLSNSSIA